MAKLLPQFYDNRYIKEQVKEENSLYKLVDIWYIRDITIGRHGKIVAKFWNEVLCDLSLEYINHKKKIRRKKFKNV